MKNPSTPNPPDPQSTPRSRFESGVGLRSSGASASAEFRAELADLAPALRARALKLCLDRTEAMDLVQDTVERALRFESSYLHGTNLKAWAHQILFSVFVTRCRKRRRERNALSTLTDDPCAWVKRDAPPPMTVLTPRLEQALDTLPAQFQAVVRLVDLEEHTYRDAAERLRAPVGTVMSRLFRGRRMLKKALGETDASVGAPPGDAPFDSSAAEPTPESGLRTAPGRADDVPEAA